MKKHIQTFALVALVGSLVALTGCGSNNQTSQYKMKPHDRDMDRNQEKTYMEDDDQMDSMNGNRRGQRQQDQSRSSSDNYRYRNQ